MGALALAHVGDAAFELMVRTHLCKNGVRSAKTLHRRTVAMVSAAAQAEAMDKLMPHLTDAEREIYLRGRNTKVHTVPKGADLACYHSATGFEALFGALFLAGEHDRLNTLFSIITDEP